MFLEKPDPLDNCHVVNTSRIDLEITCGTLTGPFTPDDYIMEIYIEENGTLPRLLKNFSNPISPHFTIQGLEPSSVYNIILYARNSKGNGEKTSIIVEIGDHPKVESSRSKY